MCHHLKFRVAAVSSNANSFGLRGHILMSRTGLAVEVALNYLNERPVGHEVRVPITPHDIKLKAINPDAIAYAVAHKMSGEIPRALPKAPKEVAAEVWAQPKQNG